MTRRAIDKVNSGKHQQPGEDIVIEASELVQWAASSIKPQTCALVDKHNDWRAANLAALMKP